MKTSTMVFGQVIVLATVWVTSVIGGPVYCIDVKSLEADADLVCGGDVVSVENRGKELLTLRGPGANTASFEAEVLVAKFVVHSILKGDAKKEITIKCHRNLVAWVPGITEGSCIVFLKKKGEFFVPVQERGYALPIDAQVVRVKSSNMQEMLKDTVDQGKRDTIRICLDTLSQLMPQEDFCSYAKQLVARKDDFLRATALLYLVEKGDPGAIALAETFTASTHEDRQIKNLVTEISLSLQDIKEREKRKQK